MTEPAAQLIMQYPIDLPTDYDMVVIRDRVRARGSALDDRLGLICKVYCVQEVGVDGAQHNQYAPFYVWGDAGAAAAFIWGGTGFNGIVRDFARPRIQTWIPAAVELGDGTAGAVTHATVRTEAIPRGTDLVAAAERLSARVGERGAVEGVHLALGGIDPNTWQSVEFTSFTGGSSGTGLHDADTEMTATQQRPVDITTFTVLHVSQPGHQRQHRS